MARCLVSALDEDFPWKPKGAELAVAVVVVSPLELLLLLLLLMLLDLDPDPDSEAELARLSLRRCWILYQGVVEEAGAEAGADEVNTG